MNALTNNDFHSRNLKIPLFLDMMPRRLMCFLQLKGSLKSKRRFDQPEDVCSKLPFQSIWRNIPAAWNLRHENFTSRKD